MAASIYTNPSITTTSPLTNSETTETATKAQSTTTSQPSRLKSLALLALAAGSGAKLAEAQPTSMRGATNVATPRLLTETCIDDIPDDSGFENFLETLNIFTRDEIDFIAEGFNNVTNETSAYEGSIKINTNECPNGIGKQTGKRIEEGAFKSAIAALQELKKSGIDDVQLTKLCFSDDINLFGDLFPYNDDVKLWYATELVFSLNVGVNAKEGDEEIAKSIEEKILNGIKDGDQYKDAAAECRAKKTKQIVIPIALVVGLAGLATIAACLCSNR